MAPPRSQPWFSPTPVQRRDRDGLRKEHFLLHDVHDISAYTFFFLLLLDDLLITIAFKVVPCHSGNWKGHFT